MLILAAMIWGLAFIAQSEGMKNVGPFTFTCLRMIVGGVTLLPVIAVMDRRRPPEKSQTSGRKLWLGGLCCGLALFAGCGAQQVGIMYTTVGKAGFISALYVVMVPILGLFFGRKPGWLLWLGVALAVAGMYFLCVKESLSIGFGEWMCLLDAFCFAVQIMIVGHFSPHVDGVRLSCIQFFVCGLAALPLMLIVEKPDLASILKAWLPILYAGVLSSGVGFTLQVIAQKQLNPTLASLLMSLESVFSALAGWLILGQRLSPSELIGCALVFLAIVLAQLPVKALPWKKR